MDKPRPLIRSDNLEGFDCGQEPLNQFLKKHALQNESSNATLTFVVVDTGRVIAYYSLAYGSVSHEASPKRVKKGLAKHPIPIILIARLAVDKTYQGKNIGAGLLKDALLRVCNAADHAGLRAVVVHAKDESAKQFYLKHGFEPSPIDELHLFLLLKDLLKSIHEE